MPVRGIGITPDKNKHFPAKVGAVKKETNVVENRTQQSSYLLTKSKGRTEK